jgi:hypothetical protein
MKRLMLSLIFSCLAASPAFPFAAEGHKTVAAIAEPLLNDTAKHAIANILGNESMMDASVFADEIKPPFGSLCKTDEAKAFNQAHGDNKKWHYVNFPVGSKKYSPTSRFAYPHDVVHLINGCVTVLEGGEFENLTPKDALRFLIHMVGDVHQPLHTVAGYYDVSDPQHPKLETNLSAITQDTASDGGGNALDYGPGELHACWDKVLVSDILATDDPVALAASVMVGVSADSYRTTGKPQGWAAKWASDSMKQAIGAYADVEFGAATFDQHGDLKKIDVTLKPSTQDYRAKNAQVVKEQLRKGGIHLAQLLNSISWDVSP